MNKQLARRGFFNALLTLLYILLVASFLFYVTKFFGSEEPETVLVPIAMLSLLVFSAALTGSLLFGAPVLWYLDGKKKEALRLLQFTLGFFFVFTLLVFVLVAVTRYL